MIIKNQVFDQERALYGSCDLRVENCSFDGPADGESAFKESKNISVDGCYFNLRYPFWHDVNVEISNSEMTPLCRAALWYSDLIKITSSKLHGIKALRECNQVEMKDCHVVSTEFGWSVNGIKAEDCSFEGEYFMLRSSAIDFKKVSLQGKYSFQYVENSVFENCEFNTKDAFWHAKNVTVRNSIVKGEYLGWYCENVTFENCKIIGTQPLCYCKGLKLINCTMEDADLCFEKSDVEATLTSPVISIKNPLSGSIELPSADEVIMDDSDAKGNIIFTK
jgi:hypothetical protein